MSGVGGATRPRFQSHTKQVSLVSSRVSLVYAIAASFLKAGTAKVAVGVRSSERDKSQHAIPDVTFLPNTQALSWRQVPNSSGSSAITQPDITCTAEMGIGFLRTFMLYFPFDY